MGREAAVNRWEEVGKLNDSSEDSKMEEKRSSEERIENNGVKKNEVGDRKGVI